MRLILEIRLKNRKSDKLGEWRSDMRKTCSFTIFSLALLAIFSLSGCATQPRIVYNSRIPIAEADLNGKKCVGPLYKFVSFGAGTGSGVWEDTGVRGGLEFYENVVKFFGDGTVINGVTKRNASFMFVREYHISKEEEVVFSDNDNINSMVFWPVNSEKNGFNGQLDNNGEYCMWKFTCSTSEGSISKSTEPEHSGFGKTTVPTSFPGLR